MIVRLTRPGLAEEVAFSASAPPTADQILPGYSYPEDGSVIRIGSATQRVVAQPGASASAQAGDGALAVSLFGGEITVDSFSVRASVAAGSVSASGTVSSSSITGLNVLGQLITPTPNLVVPLADWGSLEILGSSVESTQTPLHSAKANVTALRLKLLADHGGLLAGSMIELGSVATSVTAAPAVVAPTKPSRPTTSVPTNRSCRPTPRRSPAPPSPAHRPSSSARRRPCRRS